MNDLKDARRCAFRIGERRCRAPGNSTHTTRADSKTLWYCMSHFNDSRRGEIGLALMDEIDREWAERQAAWQNDPRHPNDKAVKAWIDGHPELKKRPDDDKFSHIYRCLAALPPGFSRTEGALATRSRCCRGRLPETRKPGTGRSLCGRFVEERSWLGTVSPFMLDATFPPGIAVVEAWPYHWPIPIECCGAGWQLMEVDANYQFEACRIAEQLVTPGTDGTYLVTAHSLAWYADHEDPPNVVEVEATNIPQAYRIGIQRMLEAIAAGAEGINIDYGDL